jgi:hypothetical protein
MTRQTDEEVMPEAELRAYLVGTIGKDHKLVIRPRKGRSERVTLVFPNESTVSITHDSRKPGLSRLAMKKLIEDLRGVTAKAVDELVASRSGGP